MTEQRTAYYRRSNVAGAPTQMWYREPPAAAEYERSQPGCTLLVTLFVLGLLVLGLAVGAGTGVALYYRSDRIMPGVSAMGVELGGRSTAQAVAALNAHWQQRRVILDAGGASWSVTPATLGMTLNAEATVQLAYQHGRSLDSLKRIIRGNGGLSVPPVWQMDLGAAAADLEALAPEAAVAPVNAGVHLVNGQVEATPAVPGRALDVTATTGWLEQRAAQVLAEGRLVLVMVPVEPAITDVSAIVDQANQWLGRTLTVHAYDPVRNETITWAITPEVWNDWTSLSVDANDPSTLDWSLNNAQVESYLAAQAAGLDPDRYVEVGAAAAAVQEAINNQQPAVGLRVYYHPRQHVVQAGETLASIGRNYGIPYPWIQQANPGLGDFLRVGQTLTIPSPDELIPLPVVENKRIVVSISQQRMWIYENGNLKWEWLASTGIDSSPTAPGVFQVRTHEPNAYASIWNLWMPYFMGIYQPVPTSEFMNGFHGFPTRGGSNLLWTSSLGRKVTYGCILISTENAAALYDWAEEGVVVEIQP